MRRICVLATCLWSGCIAMLDESLLTGGTPASDAGATVVCDEFDRGDGGVPDGWRVINGNWSFTSINDGGSSWAQTNAAGNTLYRAVYGPGSWRRETVQTELIAAAGNGIAECVMARFIDRDHFYRLCLEGGTMWRLGRVESGAVTVLKSGAITYGAGSRHLLKLMANGNQLTATVDTLAPQVAYDKLYQQGAVGLATESTTAYDRFCVEVQ